MRQPAQPSSLLFRSEVGSSVWLRALATAGERCGRAVLKKTPRRRSLGSRSSRQISHPGTCHEEHAEGGQEHHGKGVEGIHGGGTSRDAGARPRAEAGRAPCPTREQGGRGKRRAREDRRDAGSRSHHGRAAQCHLKASAPALSPRTWSPGRAGARCRSRLPAIASDAEINPPNAADGVALAPKAGAPVAAGCCEHRWWRTTTTGPPGAGRDLTVLGGPGQASAPAGLEPATHGLDGRAGENDAWRRATRIPWKPHTIGTSAGRMPRGR